jgi:hypothetical protein
MKLDCAVGGNFASRTKRAEKFDPSRQGDRSLEER